MDPITYHKAGLNDIQTLVDYRILFALELKGEQPKEAVSNLRKQMINYFTRAMAEQSCISFIAKSNDQIAGIGSVHVREQPGNFKNPSGKWGYVMNMYTVPKFRKQGICTRILEALVNESGKAGITAFELHATKTGEPVYQKSGFEIHPEPTYRKFIR